MKKRILIATAFIGACAALAGFLFARKKSYLECLKDMDEADGLMTGWEEDI